MRNHQHYSVLLLVCVMLGISLSGCGGGSHSSKDYYKNAVSNATVYVAPKPSAISQVAVLPFKAPTELIGSAVSDIFTMELLRTERYTLVERSQISGVLGETELSLSGLSEEAAIAAGRMLGADAVILGTVDEYATVASSGNTYPVVGASIRMIDCVTGEVMWSVGHSSRSEDRMATLSSHTRAVILEMMVALVQNWKLQPKDPNARSIPKAIASQPQAQFKAAGPQAQPQPEAVTAEQPPIPPQTPPPEEQALLQPPQDFSVSDMGLREVRLSWPKPAENLKYRIERSIAAEGPFQEIGTVPSSNAAFEDRGTDSAPLEDAKVYYYRIVALDDHGLESQPSPVRESMTSPAPDPPQNLQAETPDGRNVTLRWSPAVSEGIVKYRVERQAPQDSGFTDAGETETTEFQEDISVILPSNDAVEINYRVRSVNRVGAIGQPSAAVQAAPPGAETAPDTTAAAAADSTTPPVVETAPAATAPAADSAPPPPAAPPVTGEASVKTEEVAPTETPQETQAQTESRTEEIEQPDGSTIKKITTTTTRDDPGGGKSTITTTETTTSDKDGFLKKEVQTETTTITPEKGGGETTVLMTEITTTNKDGSSRKETRTQKTFKK